MSQELYQEVKSKLEKAGQLRLLRFYDQLSGEERTALLTQLKDLDFSYLDHLGEKGRPPVPSVIEPLPAMTLPEIEADRRELEDIGLRALKEGRIGAVLLAGGMGTRLGLSGPKGSCDIGVTRHVYIFQRLVENLLEKARLCDRSIPLFVMTSEANDEETRLFFREHGYFGCDPDEVHFFRQEMAPAVDDDGQVLLETRSAAAVSPNGNGGWFRSLDRAGFTRLLLESGVDYLNVFAVDNVLQNICDPAFIGAVLRSGCASGSKVVRKVSAEEKVGVMCKKDGCASVIEYYEMTEEMRQAKDQEGNRLYDFGVILNYLFRTRDLMETMDAAMPLHFAHKKIPFVDEAGSRILPEEPNGWKFEYFIFDILSCLKSCLPFEVERCREFAPIKNRTGADSVETAQELCRQNGIEL